MKEQIIKILKDGKKYGYNNEAVVLCSTSDEPENCTKEYNEEMCGECEFMKSEMVGHPGGSSYHSTVRHWCDWGHWKDDF